MPTYNNPEKHGFAQMCSIDMNSHFKPPWKIHSFGWVSMGWKTGSAQISRNEFEEWFCELAESERSNFIKEYPESPWWPNYYRFIEIGCGLGPRDKIPDEMIEIMKSVKVNQEFYAKEVYDKAVVLENDLNFEKAETLYSEILQNYGNYKDTSLRCKEIRSKNV